MVMQYHLTIKARLAGLSCGPCLVGNNLRAVSSAQLPVSKPLRRSKLVDFVASHLHDVAARLPVRRMNETDTHAALD